MKRRLLNLLTAVSLLLCVAVCVLWACSYLPEGVGVRWLDGRFVVIGPGVDTPICWRWDTWRPLRRAAAVRGGSLPNSAGALRPTPETRRRPPFQAER
jgi:hypothetical protein